MKMYISTQILLNTIVTNSKLFLWKVKKKHTKFVIHLFNCVFHNFICQRSANYNRQNLPLNNICFALEDKLEYIYIYLIIKQSNKVWRTHQKVQAELNTLNIYHFTLRDKFDHLCSIKAQFIQGTELKGKLARYVCV